MPIGLAWVLKWLVYREFNSHIHIFSKIGLCKGLILSNYVNTPWWVIFFRQLSITMSEGLHSWISPTRQGLSNEVLRTNFSQRDLERSDSLRDSHPPNHILQSWVQIPRIKPYLNATTPIMPCRGVQKTEKLNGPTETARTKFNFQFFFGSVWFWFKF